MIHGGEGDYTTGDVNRRAGVYAADCCGSRIPVAEGDRFPTCPSCCKPTDWTWLRPPS